MDGWNTTFLLGRPILRGYVSLPEIYFLLKPFLKSAGFSHLEIPHSWMEDLIMKYPVNGKRWLE